MDTLGIIFTVVLVIAAIIAIMYFVGRRLQKKQAESQQMIDQNRQKITAFIIDKKKAKNHEWRISEAVLFFFAIIGGSLGSILGMKTFHHKTKHKAFIYGMPAILFIQIALIITILFLPSLSIKIM